MCLGEDQSPAAPTSPERGGKERGRKKKGGQPHSISINQETKKQYKEIGLVIKGALLFQMSFQSHSKEMTLLLVPGII